jgi:hypothetical protein
MSQRLYCKAKGSRCSDRWAFECDHDRLLQNWAQQVYLEVSCLDREVDDTLTCATAAMPVTVAERAKTPWKRPGCPFSFPSVWWRSTCKLYVEGGVRRCTVLLIDNPSTHRVRLLDMMTEYQVSFYSVHDVLGGKVHLMTFYSTQGRQG